MTDLEIVNSALGRLGCERIASLSDNNKRAKLANDFLANSRKETLEMAPWDFALKRATIHSSGNPDFEYTHSFPIPEDLIWVVSEYNEEEYKREGSELLANTETLYLKYVYNIDETVERSASFNKAWYLNLASNLAYSLTQNNTLKDTLMAEAESIASKAMSLNAKGSTPFDYQFDSFIDPRL